MNTVIKILIAILVFSAIVIIHELGHFLLAKKNGIGVTEFCIGMGPKLIGKKVGETTYAIRALPLGGACMMVGEDEASDEDNAFNKKGVWARMSVVAAGPIFNFILAFFLALILVGFKGWDTADIEVIKDMPVAKAGIKDGDVITKINGKRVSCDREIMYALYFNPIKSDEPIEIEYKRNGKKYTKKVTPKLIKEYSITGVSIIEKDGMGVITDLEKKSPFHKAGIKNKDIIVGINDEKFKNVEELSDYLNNERLKKEITVTYKRGDKEKTVDVKLTDKSYSEQYMLGFTYMDDRNNVNALETIKYAFVEVKVQINIAIQSVKYLISGKASAEDMSGPVGIVNFIGDGYEATKSAGVGAVLLQLIDITILLSANIGVMNLLPLPALDGGRLLFMVIEVIRRKKMKPEVEGMVHAIGLVLLLLLMAVVSFNDIKKIFGL
ncbi:MAG: RIP metalloprotease RseP [Lachnospiraceae bacterium]|nr:RIP metalloprotease RseP [Lachnospiraceae bacterium]